MTYLTDVVQKKRNSAKMPPMTRLFRVIVPILFLILLVSSMVAGGASRSASGTKLEDLAPSSETPASDLGLVELVLAETLPPATIQGGAADNKYPESTAPELKPEA